MKCVLGFISNINSNLLNLITLSFDFCTKLLHFPPLGVDTSRMYDKANFLFEQSFFREEKQKALRKKLTVMKELTSFILKNKNLKRMKKNNVVKHDDNHHIVQLCFNKWSAASSYIRVSNTSVVSYSLLKAWPRTLLVASFFVISITFGLWSVSVPFQFHWAWWRKGSFTALFVWLLLCKTTCLNEFEPNSYKEKSLPYWVSLGLLWEVLPAF